jgi:hypothetical protein
MWNPTVPRFLASSALPNSKQQNLIPSPTFSTSKLPAQVADHLMCSTPHFAGDNDRWETVSYRTSKKSGPKNVQGVIAGAPKKKIRPTSPAGRMTSPIKQNTGTVSPAGRKSPLPVMPNSRNIASLEEAESFFEKYIISKRTAKERDLVCLKWIASKNPYKMEFAYRYRFNHPPGHGFGPHPEKEAKLAAAMKHVEKARRDFKPTTVPNEAPAATLSTSISPTPKKLIQPALPKTPLSTRTNTASSVHSLQEQQPLSPPPQPKQAATSVGLPSNQDPIAKLKTQLRNEIKEYKDDTAHDKFEYWTALRPFNNRRAAYLVQFENNPTKHQQALDRVDHAETKAGKQRAGESPTELHRPFSPVKSEISKPKADTTKTETSFTEVYKNHKARQASSNDLSIVQGEMQQDKTSPINLRRSSSSVNTRKNGSRSAPVSDPIKLITLTDKDEFQYYDFSPVQIKRLTSARENKDPISAVGYEAGVWIEAMNKSTDRKEVIQLRRKSRGEKYLEENLKNLEIFYARGVKFAEQAKGIDAEKKWKHLNALRAALDTLKEKIEKRNRLRKQTPQMIS